MLISKSSYYSSTSQTFNQHQTAGAEATGNSAGSTVKTANDAGEKTSANSIKQSAREKIDQDYEKAKTQGTRIVSDIANGGRFLDLQSLSDEELATVATDKGFSDNESLTARAELASRMKVALEPFANSPKQTALAVKALYPALSETVRGALGWNEAMLQGTDAIITNAGTERTSEYERQSVIATLIEHQHERFSLRFDASQLGEPRTNFSSYA